MKKSIIILTILVMLLTLSVMFTSCGDKCEHAYFSDCDEICDKCGEAREVTAEHNYYGDCDKSCHSCGKERETTKEHSWKPATCTTLESCEGCGAVKGGNLIEHSYTDVGYDDHYHYKMCSMCKKPDEDSREKHVLNDEYTCECGAEYTVKQDGEIEKDAIVELYNSNGQLIKKITYEEGEITFYFENYYNESGDVIKSENYDGDGELMDYFLYEYNENGDLLKESFYDFDAELLIYTLYHYDGNGFLVKREDFYSDDTLRKYTLYTNDKNGNVLKEEDYSFDGTLEDTDIYEYDENGNQIKRTRVNADGSTYFYQYEYDENGNLIKETYTDESENVTVEEYDENGKLIKTTYTDISGVVIVSEYNEDEKVVKETQTRPDGYWYSSAYEYDENGNIVKEAFTDDDGQHQIYEYDENGNNVRITHLWEDGRKNIVDYDERGLPIKDTSIDADGNIYCVAEYEYILVDGEWLNSKSTVTFAYGEMDTIVYEYNENGYFVKRTDTYTDGSGVIYECEYDEDGNRINETYTEFGNTAQ